MARPLQGRVALVTGGGTGIGRGIALALARRGADVALVGRRPAPLGATAAAARAHGGRAVAIPADLAAVETCAAVLAEARAALGPISILVNNAGVLAGGELATLAPGEVARAVAVNLAAPIELTRLALPDLVAGRGAVVLVASGMSLVPWPAAAVYAATKTGLRAFGEVLRYELEPAGGRVLVVYPAGTATALSRGMAAAAGASGYPLAPPAVVGERIVRLLLAGRREYIFGADQRLLALAYRLAPGLVRAVFRAQRARFARMMAASRDA